MNPLISFAVIAAAVLSPVLSARATLVTYTDRSAWLNAVGTVNIETYESYPWHGSGGNYLNNNDWFTLGSNSYYSTGAVFGDSPAVGYGAPFHIGNYVEWQHGGPLMIAFNQAVTSFGLDFGQFYGDVERFDFQFSNGDNFNTLSTFDAYSFLGVVSDTPFTVLAISSDPFPVIDNVSIGVPVPEPASYAWASTLLIAAVIVIKRRRPSAASAVRS